MNGEQERVSIFGGLAWGAGPCVASSLSCKPLKLIEVKTSLLSGGEYMRVLSDLPSLRWKWSSPRGIGKNSKGAHRIIFVASYRTVRGRGPLIQKPDFYDFPYEELIDALEHPHEGITLSMLGGWNIWSKMFPALKLKKASVLTERYGRNATRLADDNRARSVPEQL
jgi:hypothetical protein